MTSYFDAVQDEPQIRPRLGQLSPEERMTVRSIRIPTGGSVSTGRFAGVAYVLGDERRAAEVFVEENRDGLEAVDFSRQNIISRNVDREVYDWILHELGERELQKYDTVVIEHRPNENVTWCISRREYEENPTRRYSTGSEGSARVADYSLAELYDDFGTTITEQDLKSHSSAAGDVRQILDSFRVSDAFDCQPISLGDQLAVEKVDWFLSRWVDNVVYRLIR